MHRRDVWPLTAIGFVLAVTAAWWTFALLPVPGAPDWLERARSVCFNLGESGLPDAKGWLLLIGEPPVMLAFLFVGWRDAVSGSVRRLLASGLGRAAVVGVAGLGTLGAGWAAARIADARPPAPAWGVPGMARAEQPRLDRPWPEMDELVDQSGAPVTTARIGSAGAFVTFAFGHCETLCPLVVEQVRSARDAVRRTQGLDMSVLVLTVDPWRDTPSRLGPLLERWGLDPTRDLVVGGPVDAVLTALAAWDVSTTRDPRSGDVVHPGIAYLVEPDGTVAYASTGGAEHLVAMAGRLKRTRHP